MNRKDIAESICNLPQLASKFRKLEPLDHQGGEGTFSIIIKAWPGRKPIILKVNNPFNEPYRVAAFQREYDLLDKLRGVRGIVQLLGQEETIRTELRFGDGGKPFPLNITYFPMEMAKTDLAAMIHTGDGMPKVLNILMLFRGACRSLRRLHTNRICHRDLKPGNLLVFPKGEVKIGDLGCARQLGEGARGILETYSFPRGAVLYTAPELLCVTREYDRAFLDGDFYSLGAILFETITGRVFGDYVYTLEYLLDLAAYFQEIPVGQKEDIFQQLLPSIIERNPPPRLTETTDKVPKSIEGRLESLYRGLTEPRVNKRLRDFDEIFRRLDVMIRILQHEQKRKPWNLKAIQPRSQ